MSRSLVKLAAIILIIAGLAFVALYGLDFTDTARFPGVVDPDGVVQGLDLKGGSVIVFEAQKEGPTEDEMKIVESLLRTRLDGLGYTEGTVTRQGSDKVRVEIPSLTDTAAAVEALGATAQLLFLDAEGNEIMTGAYVKDARAEFSPVEPGGKNEHHLVLEFTGEGQQKFAEATAKAAAAAAPNNIIAITMDGKVLSAPSVKEAIDNDSCIVHGGFENDDEVISLANNIRSGQLPFSLERVESRTVSATLGDDALNRAVTAGFIGLILVMLFMILIYRLPGLMSAIALLAYISIVGIILAVFHVNMTLPGIAGVILAIGMAVDANVVIFERIKEELRLGKTVRSAVDAGFNRALSAVIDSNVTTIISAVILWWLGTGTIKGFGITLLLGVVISMFSAIFITKFLLKQMIGMNVKGLWFYGINPKKLAKGDVK